MTVIDPANALRLGLAIAALASWVATGAVSAATATATATIARPATVTARLADPTPSAGPTLRLRVGTADRATASAVLVRVFVNQPSADSRTILSSAGYVNSFALSAESGGEEEVALPLAPELARLLRAERSPATVTIAPVPLSSGETPRAATVAIDDAELGGH